MSPCSREALSAIPGKGLCPRVWHNTTRGTRDLSTPRKKWRCRTQCQSLLGWLLSRWRTMDAKRSQTGRVQRQHIALMAWSGSLQALLEMVQALSTMTTKEETLDTPTTPRLGRRNPKASLVEAKETTGLKSLYSPCPLQYKAGQGPLEKGTMNPRSKLA